MRKSFLWAALLTLSLSLPAALALASEDPGIQWPSGINHGQGFQSLGWAIKAYPGFPKNGTNIEQARYVFQHIPTIADKYGLHPGTGTRLENSFIFMSRLFSNLPVVGYDDPEDTAMLNGMVGIGDCAEWSYAFAEILNGAGVPDIAVGYGDSDPAEGRSLGFTGTDTMVVVYERDPATKRWSRRVFDAFQAAYNGPKLKPDAASVADWMDVPLDECDRWKDEPARETWLKAVGKSYVKNSGDLKVMMEPSIDRIRPDKVNRPQSSPKSTGRNWVLKDVKVYPADPFDQGPTWRRGATKAADSYTYEEWGISQTDGSLIINDKFTFAYDSPPAMLMPGEKITLTVKGTASIGPHVEGARKVNWASYSISGIASSSTDPAYIGLFPDERGLIPSATSTITFTVPAEGPDTVVITESYDKGVLAEYTYKRGS